MHSAWIAYDGTNCDAIRKLDRSFLDSSNLLSGLHINYHYGDETMMANHGYVENGRLIIGECAYSAVILPLLETLDERFRAAFPLRRRRRQDLRSRRGPDADKRPF